jgi:hypothetical protein
MLRTTVNDQLEEQIKCRHMNRLILAWLQAERNQPSRESPANIAQSTT